MNTARREMGPNVAEQRIRRTLKLSTPSGTKFNHQSGDSVRVYREDTNKWVGTYRISRLSGRTIHLTDGKSTRPFKITQIIPATTTNHDTDWQSTLRTLEKQSDIKLIFNLPCLDIEEKCSSHKYTRMLTSYIRGTKWVA